MNSPAPNQAYDAFGDPALGTRAPMTATRRARRMAVAVFWSVAMLIIAARVYQSDVLPQTHPIAIAAR